MLSQILNENDLPIQELAKFGLVDNGKLNLERKDIQALLSGNRTSLLTLNNINYDGMEIKELNLKLSLTKNDKGGQMLVFHPVYRQAVPPPFITAMESDELMTGLKANLVKEVFRDGQDKSLMVEYDQDTREFLVTDTRFIKAPHQVNDIALSPYQRERYQQGREIELEDGTKIQASSSVPDSIRSNRLALVVSVLMDGGLSYLLLQGLKALTTEKGKSAQLAAETPGFKQAKLSYDRQESVSNAQISQTLQSHNQLPGRSYTRNGMSR